jgi:hypothetical protein
VLSKSLSLAMILLAITCNEPSLVLVYLSGERHAERVRMQCSPELQGECLQGCDINAFVCHSRFPSRLRFPAAPARWRWRGSPPGGNEIGHQGWSRFQPILGRLIHPLQLVNRGKVVPAVGREPKFVSVVLPPWL